MNHDLDTVLDECLNLMRAGADVQVCLARYPQYATELYPLLTVAADVRAVTTPAPAVTARTAGRQRMLDASAQKQARLTGRGIRRATRVRQLAVAVVIVVLVAIGEAAITSAASLPGDVLYPVKLAVQQARVTVTFDATTRQQLAEQFNVQQRQDVQKAMRTKRQAAIELQGVLEQMNEQAWVVSGLTVRLKTATVVVGRPRLRAWVTVRGYLPGDGSLVATRLMTGGGPASSPTATQTGQGKVSPSFLTHIYKQFTLRQVLVGCNFFAMVFWRLI